MSYEKVLRRTWAEIELNALKKNYDEMRSRISPGAKIMAVVKADAYGHGAEECSAVLDKAGADCFAVSNIDEALQLRRCGIEKPVLILGYTPPEYANMLAVNNISQAVFSLSYAKALSAEASKLGFPVSIHIKVDTGMSRIGFVYHDSVADSGTIDEILQAVKLDFLYTEGIFTHFSRADEVNGEAYTRLQFELFTRAVSLLEKQGVGFEYRHCCNSAASVDYPEMNLDMVRLGIVLYGLKPSDELKTKIPLKPVMTLKTVVSQVKTLSPETPVSYGGTFVTTENTKTATVAIGYGDGYSRLLSSKADMLVKGKRARIIGRVCMDQTLLNVSDIDSVASGNEVTVFGESPAPTADEIADIIGTINYEIVCNVGKRVPRLYVTR